MRVARAWLVVLFGVAACGDGNGPNVASEAVTVVYTDASGHASVVRSGSAPEPLSALDTASLFASTTGGVFRFKNGRISVFRFADPVLRSFEDRQESAALITRGAVSRDGHLLAYATQLNADVYLHVVDIASGARDSINVSNKGIEAAPQIIFSVPVWSPDADSVAFLLPNDLGMQLFLYERASRRLEVKVLKVPTTTYFEPLQGFPSWASDGAIRFLTRRKEGTVMLDTLVVLRVNPREGFPQAVVAYRAVPPDSLPMSDAWASSFTPDGRSVAFVMATGAKTAVMVMRQGKAQFETLAYGTGVAPADLLLVP